MSTRNAYDKLARTYAYQKSDLEALIITAVTITEQVSLTEISNRIIAMEQCHKRQIETETKLTTSDHFEPPDGWTTDKQILFDKYIVSLSHLQNLKHSLEEPTFLNSTLSGESTGASARIRSHRVQTSTHRYP